MPTPYVVIILRQARKAIAGLPTGDQARILAAIADLSNDPRPQGAKKLTGGSAWRIRVGNYRIIYEIDDESQTVTVTAAGQRGGIYR